MRENRTVEITVFCLVPETDLRRKDPDASDYGRVGGSVALSFVSKNLACSFRRLLCTRFTFHVEATDKVAELIETVKAKGMGVGVALKPGTPVEVSQPLPVRTFTGSLNYLSRIQYGNRGELYYDF